MCWFCTFLSLNINSAHLVPLIFHIAPQREINAKFSTRGCDEPEHPAASPVVIMFCLIGAGLSFVFREAKKNESVAADSDGLDTEPSWSDKNGWSFSGSEPPTEPNRTDKSSAPMSVFWIAEHCLRLSLLGRREFGKFCDPSWRKCEGLLLDFKE